MSISLRACRSYRVHLTDYRKKAGQRKRKPDVSWWKTAQIHRIRMVEALFLTVFAKAQPLKGNRFCAAARQEAFDSQQKAHARGAAPPEFCLALRRQFNACAPLSCALSTTPRPQRPASGSLSAFLCSAQRGRPKDRWHRPQATHCSN